MFRIFGGILMFIGFVLLALSPVISPFIFLLGLTLIFGYSGVKVDADQKQVRSFSSYLGLKTGEWESYEEISKIYITRVKSSYTMYSRSNLGMDVTKYEYDAYMKVDGESYYLGSHKDKNRLAKNISPICKYLQLECQDMTNEEE